MRFIIVLVLLLSNFAARAQDPSKVEMADAFRAEGKIYVVLAVILILLIGLFAYLIRLDAKMTKLEKEKIDKV